MASGDGFPADTTELTVELTCSWKADIDPDEVVRLLGIGAATTTLRGQPHKWISTHPLNSFAITLVERKQEWNVSDAICEGLSAWSVSFEELSGLLQGADFRYFVTVACWTDGSSFGGYVNRKALALLHKSSLELDISFYG